MGITVYVDAWRKCWRNGRETKNRNLRGFVVEIVKQLSYYFAFLLSKFLLSKCIEMKHFRLRWPQAKGWLETVGYIGGERWLLLSNNIFTLVDFEPSSFLAKADAVFSKTVPFNPELAVVVVCRSCGFSVAWLTRVEFCVSCEFLFGADESCCLEMDWRQIDWWVVAMASVTVLVTWTTLMIGF